MYPNEYTRNPFHYFALPTIERLNGYKSIIRGKCHFGDCGITYRVPGTNLCEDHAMQVFDQIIAYKGYDYMLARAGSIKAAMQFEKDRINERVARIERERKERETQQGWVYYIKMDDLIKIGFTKNVWIRTKAYPPTAEFLAAHPGTRAVERTMHHKFAHLLAEGREWFRSGDDLTKHIESVLEQFPKQPISYEFRKNTPTFKKVA